MMTSNGLYLSHLLEDGDFHGNDIASLDDDENTISSEDGDLFGLIPLDDVVRNNVDDGTSSRRNDFSHPGDLQEQTQNCNETSTQQQRMCPLITLRQTTTQIITMMIQLMTGPFHEANLLPTIIYYIILLF